MKLQLQQNTPEWHEWRKGNIGGSDIGVILGLSKYKTPYQLWLEKTGKVQAPDLSGNFFINRGHELEPEARQLASVELNADFLPMCFEHNTYSFMRYSCDGYDELKNSIIEIKCPGETNHNLFLAGHTDDSYYAQTQFGMMVSGAEFATFISYNKKSSDPFYMRTIIADESFQDKILKAAIDFKKLIDEDIPPEFTLDDERICEDPEYVDMVAEYLDIENQMDKLDKRQCELEKKLKELCDDERPYVRCGDVRLTKVVQKGRVDYNKIDILKDIDLDKFRKDNSHFVRLTKVKKNDSSM